MIYICVSKLNIIGSDNGLLPGQHKAIIWTKAGLLLIGPLRTNISEILIGIYTVSFSKMHLKILSGNWQPSCLNLSVLNGNTIMKYALHVIQWYLNSNPFGNLCNSTQSILPIHWNIYISLRGDNSRVLKFTNFWNGPMNYTHFGF